MGTGSGGGALRKSEGLTDQELCDLLHYRRDAEAGAELVRRHGDCLLRYATRLCGGPEGGEELFQEVWSRFFSKIRASAFKVLRGGVPAFLTTIARNCWRSRGRRKKPGLLTDDVPGREERPDEAASMREEVSRLRAAVEALHPSDRTLLELWFEGLGLQEIASKHRKSVAYVFRRLEVLKRRLRRLLAGEKEQRLCGQKRKPGRSRGCS
jgi:RNA polymerase sigma factor (sigma-70 family)